MFTLLTSWWLLTLTHIASIPKLPDLGLSCISSSEVIFIRDGWSIRHGFVIGLFFFCFDCLFSEPHDWTLAAKQGDESPYHRGINKGYA